MGSVRLWLLGGAILAAASALSAEDLIWGSDLAAAEKRAIKDHKLILLDFTGSDWCGYCRMLDSQVISSDEFGEFASKYILVRVDFPKFHSQDSDEKSRNRSLAMEYKIEGYPTLVLVGPTGREIRRVEGYEPKSGAAAYLAQFY
ncbi:MAG TPA: thioredoxin family protein [Opitutaceae bacterium]|jgi:thioredoxin-related protein